MSDNKTKPTSASVDEFLATVSEERAAEARTLMDIMGQITSEPAIMWGPSIIGFGTVHYKYETGREGDMPLLGFSPRKSAITIYFTEGFDEYIAELQHLGTYKTSKSCLYISKLTQINLDILTKILQASIISSKHNNSRGE